MLWYKRNNGLECNIRCLQGLYLSTGIIFQKDSVEQDLVFNLILEEQYNPEDTIGAIDDNNNILLCIREDKDVECFKQKWNEMNVSNSSFQKIISPKK